MHWYGEAKEGGVICEGLVDGVKAPPGLSALSPGVLPDLAS